MRSAVAHLSTSNLLHNLSVIKNLVGPAKCIAMIKANAYGHGLRSTAIRLQSQADFFGVASIDEALQLRQVGIQIPIILMEGIFEAEELAIAANKNLHIVFHTKEQINWFLDYSNQSNINVQFKVWIKFDTGMGRLGFGFAEGLEIYHILSNHPAVAAPIGIMSHLACADDIYHPLNQLQLNDFDILVGSNNFKENIIKSLCNSGGIFNFSKYYYDAVRPGIALYGVSPLINKSAQELQLRPVMTLTTRIIAIKNLAKNSTIGYGARFVCPKDLKIAIIAIGYGDGYPRSAQDGTPVLIKAKRCGIVGRISMDMAVVDLSNCLEAKVGDQVILWGEGLPIEEVVKTTANSVYDLLTAVQYRVKFVWQD